jgi:ribosome-associated protein
MIAKRCWSHRRFSLRLDEKSRGTVWDVTDALPVRGSIAIPRAELRWRFSRSSGPGGQGVNTADSRVELRWDLAATEALPEPLKARALDRLSSRLVDGVLSVVVSEQRAQLQNRQIAERRLVALVAAAIAPPPARRRPTKPSRAAVERRLTAKRRTGETKILRQRPRD